MVPSKKDFIANNIIPANDNDAFNDGKCAYCWGTYDDDHLPARILPCNHVFGWPCIMEWLDSSATSHLCMVCRTQLYQADFWTDMKRISVVASLQVILTFFAVNFFKIPRWLRKVILAWTFRNEPCVWAHKILSWTDFRHRNPAVQTDMAFLLISLFEILTHLFILFATKSALELPLLFTDSAFCLWDNWAISSPEGKATASSLHILMALNAARLGWRDFIQGKIHNRKDQVLLAAFFVGTVVLQHFEHLWIIVCYYQSWSATVGWFGYAIHIWNHLDIVDVLRYMVQRIVAGS
ncbi:hypothetical protein BDV96DRAFT_19164 [Lophiotrema nucula]|uniref:RING-type domain-containing protein n=1 Tax=Lophiotrema nucula TaxID=690887 RepID=A0A6A5ZC57_9PLEO|nr:hypothetical protein BDV96DRAFT_19164 [Lophiotrema nucula]